MKCTKALELPPGLAYPASCHRVTAEALRWHPGRDPYEDNFRGEHSSPDLPSLPASALPLGALPAALSGPLGLLPLLPLALLHTGLRGVEDLVQRVS